MNSTLPYLANGESTTECPICKSNWIGSPIPDAYREEYYGGKTHYSRLIGIEHPGIYDGILIWKCPDCGQEFNRFNFNK